MERAKANLCRQDIHRIRIVDIIKSSLVGIAAVAGNGATRMRIARASQQEWTMDRMVTSSTGATEVPSACEGSKIQAVRSQPNTFEPTTAKMRTIARRNITSS